jgi:adenosine deaminase
MTETVLDDTSYLRALPKAELHCHLEGSVPAATMIELARRNGAPLPTYDAAELYQVDIGEDEFQRLAEHMPSWIGQGFARKYQRRIDTPDDFYGLAVFESFLERFDQVCGVLQTAEDFSRAAYDSLITAADQANVRYREMFFHPMNHPGVSYRTMVDGLIDGIRAAAVDRRVIGRLIPAINRDCSAAAAAALAQQVVSYRTDEIAGLASDYDEEHLPAFREAYEIAARAGLPATAHAGEYGTAQSIAEAIDILGCTRIDHGYAITTDADLTQRAIEAGIHFTCIFSWSIAITQPACWPLDPPALPPSRRVTSPVAAMLDAGMSISLSSDDPAFDGFGSLADEYVWAAGSLEFDRDRMTELSLAAIDGAWLDEAAKTALRQEFRNEIGTLTGTTAGDSAR